MLTAIVVFGVVLLAPAFLAAGTGSGTVLLATTASEGIKESSRRRLASIRAPWASRKERRVGTKMMTEEEALKAYEMVQDPDLDYVQYAEYMDALPWAPEEED